MQVEDSDPGRTSGRVNYRRSRPARRPAAHHPLQQGDVRDTTATFRLARAADLLMMLFAPHSARFVGLAIIA